MELESCCGSQIVALKMFLRTHVFLVVNKQLYKRLCPSVSPWVCPSVRRSVTRFSKTANSSKFNKIQQNSKKFTTFRNCWPGDGLVSCMPVSLSYLMITRRQVYVNLSPSFINSNSFPHSHDSIKILVLRPQTWRHSLGNPNCLLPRLP